MFVFSFLVFIVGWGVTCWKRLEQVNMISSKDIVVIYGLYPQSESFWWGFSSVVVERTRSFSFSYPTGHDIRLAPKAPLKEQKKHHQPHSPHSTPDTSQTTHTQSNQSIFECRSSFKD